MLKLNQHGGWWEVAIECDLDSSKHIHFSHKLTGIASALGTLFYSASMSN